MFFFVFGFSGSCQKMRNDWKTPATVQLRRAWVLCMCVCVCVICASDADKIGLPSRKCATVCALNKHAFTKFVDQNLGQASYAMCLSSKFHFRVNVQSRSSPCVVDVWAFACDNTTYWWHFLSKCIMVRRLNSNLHLICSQREGHARLGNEFKKLHCFHFARFGFHLTCPYFIQFDRSLFEFFF